MSANAKYLMFLPLITYSPTGELRGWLAERVDYSDDRREAVFHLNRRATWHDGVPVTAHDVKFSMDLMTHPDVLEESPGYFGTVTVVDDWTVRVRDGRVTPDEVYYPRHLLHSMPPRDFYRSEFWLRPVGNGPYRFRRAIPETMIELEANPSYFRGRPKINRVVLKFAQENAVTELLAGEVDAAVNLAPAEVLRLRADERLRVYYRVAGQLARVLYWQHRHPVFRDRRVRRAFILALDRRELLRAVNLPDDLPLLDGPTTHRQLRSGRLPTSVRPDRVAAAALLEAAGWRPGPNGLRLLNGKPLRVEFLTASTPPGPQMATMVREQLRQIGAEAEIRVLETPYLRQRIREGRFDMALGTSSGGLLSRFRFGRGAPLGYENREVVALTEQLETQRDPDVEDRIHARLTAINVEDAAVSFLFPEVEMIVAHRRIRGLSSPWRSDPVWVMGDLWIGG